MDKFFPRPRHGRLCLFASIFLAVLSLFLAAPPPPVHASPQVPGSCDVLVAGGGAGGISAAISAARLGARVVAADQLSRESAVRGRAGASRCVSGGAASSAITTGSTRPTCRGASRR